MISYQWKLKAFLPIYLYNLEFQDIVQVSAFIELLISYPSNKQLYFAITQHVIYQFTTYN